MASHSRLDPMAWAGRSPTEWRVLSAEIAQRRAIENIRTIVERMRASATEAVPLDDESDNDEAPTTLTILPPPRRLAGPT